MQANRWLSAEETDAHIDVSPDMDAQRSGLTRSTICGDPGSPARDWP